MRSNWNLVYTLAFFTEMSAMPRDMDNELGLTSVRKPPGTTAGSSGHSCLNLRNRARKNVINKQKKHESCL